jgi:DNA-binding CsgD family transcriptional regulator
MAAIGDGPDGRGPVVTLRGPQGVGRTRVCLELAERARLAGWSVTLLRGAGHGADPRARVDTTGPALVVIDDIERLDHTTLHSLGQPDTAALVCAVRGADTPPVQATHTIDVTPLTFAGTEDLLVAWLDGPVTTETVAAAHVACGGRPMWLREWIDAARRQGHLRSIEGLWHVADEPRPTARSRELAHWATESISPEQQHLLRAIGHHGPQPLGEVPVDASGWLQAADGVARAAVPWAAASLVAPAARPSRVTSMRHRLVAAPSFSVDALLEDLFEGHALAARSAVEALRDDAEGDPSGVAALSLGLIDLWLGGAADRWFTELAISGLRPAVAELGAHLARARRGAPTGDVVPAIEWGDLPGSEPWLLNAGRARAWRLAALGEPAAIDAFDEAIVEAEARGGARCAAVLAADAALYTWTLAENPLRSMAAAKRLRAVPSPWSSTLGDLLEALARMELEPAGWVGVVGLATQTLIDLGDAVNAREGLRIAGNQARRAGLLREADELHVRARALPAEGAWNRDLPATVLALPNRQRQIVLLAARGRSNRDIAALLAISPRTVENQLHRAFSELDVRDRAQLSVLAG